MVEIFEIKDDDALIGHLRACGVSQSGDFLDQTAENMQLLLQEMRRA